MTTATAPLDAQRLRTTMGHFATGVTVITTRADDGGPLGTTGSAAANWDEVAHRADGASGPHLHGALAVFDCALEDVHPGGDHEIVVGRIEEVELGDALAAPLLHFRGTYAGLAS